MRRVLITTIITLIVSLLSACAYKPDVRQGNILDDDQINKLTIGMSRQQVISLMGSPMLQDTFHKNRWDYIQAYTHERNPIQRRLLTLYFKGDQLVKIDNSELKEKQLIN